MLELYHITFRVKAQTIVHMGPQAGGQLRGTLWKALEKFACSDPTRQHDPLHTQHCPMCYLLELKQRSPRGQNPPRPFALRPPLAVRVEEDRRYESGTCFDIGMVVIGDAVRLFPYLCQGMQLAGQQGVGYPQGGKNKRGRFTIVEIINHNPLAGAALSLFDGETVNRPALPIMQQQIRQHAAALPDDHIRLRFLTPTQLKHQGQLLPVPQFDALIARVLERLQALTYHYTDTAPAPDVWRTRYQSLTEAAHSIKRSQDNTRVVTVYSGSRRSNRYHDIGGFVGEVLYQGDLAPFRVWLVWGALLHVGKNTVKGDGWYEIA